MKKNLVIPIEDKLIYQPITGMGKLQVFFVEGGSFENVITDYTDASNFYQHLLG